MHRTIRLFAVFLTVLFSSYSVAESPETPWYEFEVIVFLNNSSAGGQSEVWRDSTPPENLPDAIDPYERQSPVAGIGNIQTPIIELLPASQYQLTEVYSRLDRSPRYTPLVHLGWRQPVQSDDLARGVRLHTNEPLQNSSTTYPGLQRDREIALHRLDGIIRLSINRYLHADVDLYLRDSGYPQQVSDYNSATRAIRYFNLNESRRIKSNEVHYLDHPLFGLLLSARPYTRPDDELLPR